MGHRYLNGARAPQRPKPTRRRKDCFLSSPRSAIPLQRISSRREGQLRPKEGTGMDRPGKPQMDAEHRRLEETRSKAAPWKKWGPYLSERQWGTVREDYSEVGRRLELLQPRPGPLARLSLGRGRAGRHLRRPAAALLRAGPVERQGPDPQGAAVRPDQQRGQSRRGRQGVLLLPRLHADPLVHEVPLQVSAGGLPVRRPRRDQPRPGPAGVRVRAARHGRVRPGSLLRRVRRVRQGVAGRHPDPDHRPQPRSGAGDAARAADALVPQRVVVGRRCRPAGAPAGRLAMPAA